MKLINKYFIWLEDSLLSYDVPKINLWWFGTATYSMLILKLLLLWPKVYQFYDVMQQTAIAVKTNPINWFSKILLLTNPSNLNLLVVFSLGAAATSLFYRNILTAALAFIISLNYNTIIAKAINGGDYVLTFFCFILIFTSGKPLLSENRKLVSNAAWLLLLLNFCNIYFINGYGKVIKKMWLDGEAIYLSWNLNYFANPHLIPSFFYNRLFCMVIGWLTILFELGFIFLIWHEKPKKVLLIAGILLHLGIAIFLSIPDFALTMLIGYIPFFKENWFKNKKAVKIH